MEKRTLALGNLIKERRPKKGTLDPRKWMSQKNASEFDDFMYTKASDEDTDNGFNDEEMCECTVRQKRWKIETFFSWITVG